MTNKRNKWTENEITFLKENYETKGLKFCVTNLSKHPRNSIVKKAKNLGIKVDQSIYYYDLNEIKKIVKTSFSYAEVHRKLKKTKSGDSYKSLKRYLDKNNIDVSHFNPYKNNGGNQYKTTIHTWLKNGTSIGSSKLKEKLYKEGLKNRKCEKCGQDEWWKGEKISLILDHKNGVNNDNRLENLRIVCPNCSATLPTHCRGKKQLINI